MCFASTLPGIEYPLELVAIEISQTGIINCRAVNDWLIHRLQNRVQLGGLQILQLR
jgi:hypothetical protein